MTNGDRTVEQGESHVDQIARVQHMTTDDGETWDLSDNDAAALTAVLADRVALLAALREMVAIYDGTRDLLGATVAAKLARADAAIAKAEGRA